MSLESQPLSKSKHLDPAGYLSTKTIAALCTPVGGALCLMRISGSESIKIAAELCGTSTDFFKLHDRRAQKVNLRDSSGRKIDEAIAISFQEPRSFTGEDVIEFFLHGSPLIAQKTLDEVFSKGARLALPGEFSFRAVKNGKINLSQAEAIKELIKAENDFALDLALEKLSGSQHELLNQTRDELMQLVTLAEAGIDFSDQDLDEVSLPRLKERLKKVVTLLEDLGGSFNRGKRFLEGVPVSIFGLPNAGKSSFFNALLGEDRSIVSDVAGTTRDVVQEKINLKGPNGYVTFKIADTAGLRKSKDVIEEMGIERSLKAAKDSDLIIVVVDGVDPNWKHLNLFLDQVIWENKTWIGVITKKDLLTSDQVMSTTKEAQTHLKDPTRWLSISSQTTEGVTKVAETLALTADKLLTRKPGEVVLTQIEHVQAVKRSLECLNRASQSSDIVLFATDIRHGMNDLGPLLGETLPDDILGKIFSDFCIGK